MQRVDSDRYYVLDTLYLPYRNPYGRMASNDVYDPGHQLIHLLLVSEEGDLGSVVLWTSVQTPSGVP